MTSLSGTKPYFFKKLAHEFQRRPLVSPALDQGGDGSQCRRTPTPYILCQGNSANRKTKISKRKIGRNGRRNGRPRCSGRAPYASGLPLRSRGASRDLRPKGHKQSASLARRGLPAPSRRLAPARTIGRVPFDGMKLAAARKHWGMGSRPPSSIPSCQLCSRTSLIPPIEQSSDHELPCGRGRQVCPTAHAAAEAGFGSPQALSRRQRRNRCVFKTASAKDEALVCTDNLHLGPSLLWRLV